ncbi:MAG: hypothetical protein P4L53_20720 [Candidatus Obscuribacterales bacterium]|nr:hypothetical protein [Candidatus Obscuribacterales bacterium]
MSRRSIIVSRIAVTCIALLLGRILILGAMNGHKWFDDLPFDNAVWKVADNDLFDRAKEPKKAEESSRLYMAGLRERMVFSLSRRLAGKSMAEVRALLGPENQTKRVNPSELTYPLGPDLIDTRFMTIEFRHGIYYDYHLWAD